MVPIIFELRCQQLISVKETNLSYGSFIWRLLNLTYIDGCLSCLESSSYFSSLNFLIISPEISILFFFSQNLKRKQKSVVADDDEDDSTFDRMLN